MPIGEKVCANCGKIFYPLKRWQIYCDRSCNVAAYYIRKTRRPKDSLEALDLEDGPSDAQLADRKRRIEGTEDSLKEAEDIREMEVEERNEMIEKMIEEKNKPSGIEMFINKEDK
jgi:hypothetical protein